VTAAGRHLIVPDPVVVEVDWLLRERVSPASARAFLDALAAGAHERAPVSGELFRRAVEIDHQYRALGLGLVDAVVMAVAEARDAAILTFDFTDFRATKPARGRSWRLVIEEAEYERWRRRRQG